MGTTAIIICITTIIITITTTIIITTETIEAALAGISADSGNAIAADDRSLPVRRLEA